MNQLAYLLKIIIFPPLVSILPPFKVFQIVPPSHLHASNTPPTITWHTNLPYTSLTGLNRYQMGDFTSSPIEIYQKSILNCLNLFTYISGYLNLWDIFCSFLDDFECLFLVAEKIYGGSRVGIKKKILFRKKPGKNVLCWSLS